jgi:hypothetical protein
MIIKTAFKLNTLPRQPILTGSASPLLLPAGNPLFSSVCGDLQYPPFYDQDLLFVQIGFVVPGYSVRISIYLIIHANQGVKIRIEY